MATKRRVKRVRRTRKQSNRVRGRKTCNRHNRGGMFKFMASTKTEDSNPKDGNKYNGIEVWIVKMDDGARYYIGNRPLQTYLQSSNPADRVYGTKIETALQGIQYKTSPVDAKVGADMIYLDEAQFMQFKMSFKKEAKPLGGVQPISAQDNVQRQIINLQNQIDEATRKISELNAKTSTSHSLQFKKSLETANVQRKQQIANLQMMNAALAKKLGTASPSHLVDRMVNLTLGSEDEDAGAGAAATSAAATSASASLPPGHWNFV